MSGLAARATEGELEDLFATHGKVGGRCRPQNHPADGLNLTQSCLYVCLHTSQQIIKAQVMYDPHSREPRGFGFVTFENVDDAEAAITALDGQEFLGRTLKIQKVRRFARQYLMAPSFRIV